MGAGPIVAQQSPAPDFIPDFVFEGSSLDQWQTLGAAQWQADDGVISGSGNGALIFDKGLQDAAVFSRFKCSGTCDAGVLLRIEEAGREKKAILVHLGDETAKPYRVTLDADGKLTDKMYAFDPEIEHRPFPWTSPTKIKNGEWNSIEIFIEENVVANHLNNERSWARGGMALDKPAFQKGDFDTHLADGFGPVGLYVGSGSVAFQDVVVKDLNQTQLEPEMVSDRFEMQRINAFAYAWGADAADVNRDGEMDIITGPFFYLGPDFTMRGEFYPARTFSPAEEYVPNMVTHAFDWTGDGWPDVMITDMRPLTLYTNPQGESRRWDRKRIVSDVCGEIALRGDMDNDGVADEIAYVAMDGTVVYIEPESEAEDWASRKISGKIGPGMCSAHGLGIGDVSGDGREDILLAYGWLEQPAENPASTIWAFHKENFGGQLNLRVTPS